MCFNKCFVYKELCISIFDWKCAKHIFCFLLRNVGKHVHFDVAGISFLPKISINDMTCQSFQLTTKNQDPDS